MDLKEEFYGKQVSDTVNCFSNRLSVIAEKYSEYCKENEINFIENILLVYNVDILKYSYIKELPFNITEDVRIAFEECFSKNSTDGKLINPNKNQ